MGDRPYTDEDLRAEAARQVSAHGPDTRPEQAYAAMLDARIESTRDTDGPTWSEALDASELNAPALAIHALIKGAADMSEWAVRLGADGLQPHARAIDIGWNDGPLQARIHIAFTSDVPDGERDQFVTDISDAIAGTVPVR